MFHRIMFIESLNGTLVLHCTAQYKICSMIKPINVSYFAHSILNMSWFFKMIDSFQLYRTINNTSVTILDYYANVHGKLENGDTYKNRYNNEPQLLYNIKLVM